MAAAHPNVAALKVPCGRMATGAINYFTLTFAELDAEVAAWQGHLVARGVRRGDRTLVMVRPGLPLIASAFALFRIGAVPIIIDPGMGLKSFLACVKRSRPRALLGIPLAQFLSRVCFRAFRSVEVRVSASSSLTARIAPEKNAPPVALAESAPEELAAILFTSGSTGAPKGVCYEHGMFEAQVRQIRDAYGIQPGEVDLPLLPIFALFNPALGMTSVIPEIDPKRPAAVDPAKIVQAIQQEKITNSFGSPTLWHKIGEHCRTQGITLPTLRRVLCAGAPVPALLWRNSRTWLVNGQLHSPYGATEALPVSSISADEVDTETLVGACVGRPMPEIEVKVIAIDDNPIATLAEAREVPRGEIGEIIVRGPVVTKEYDGNTTATAAAKIKDGNTIWHRMGDCGFLDEAGRLWFCGRKVERVVTLHGTFFTEPCERVFRQHPQVTRCALIGLRSHDRVRAALVVEAQPKDSAACRAFARELRGLARQHKHTEFIAIFYFNPSFPVDVRHNAKIHRLTLAKWAETAKGFQSDPKR